MKISLEKNDLDQIIYKINPKLKIEDWTEEGILLNSNIDGFKGKLVMNFKFDNLSQKIEIDLKLKELI